MVLCGKSICRCREDPDARHGPYYQWSGKRKGKTVSAYLSDAQAEDRRGVGGEQPRDEEDHQASAQHLPTRGTPAQNPGEMTLATRGK